MQQVNGTDRIEDVKAKLVQSQAGFFPLDQQRLLFAGRQLQDGTSLHEYGVCKESTLHVTASLRGGGSGDAMTQARFSGP